MAALAAVDWAVVALYVAGLLALGAWAGRAGRGGGADEYYLAGRNLPAWALGVSILATQASAVSLIGAPAFVARHPDGGLKWLQYELAVPVAAMALVAFLVPVLRRGGHVSVYEYLERRFDRRVRVAVSLAFQASRALATGVAIYAIALVLAAALGWSVGATILLVGVVTVAYDAAGGMRAVVWSDVLQMAVLLGGLAAATAVVLAEGGGAGRLVSAVDPERTRTLVLDGGGDFGIWPMLLGGFFLYASYYGVDQSQAQRWLAARSEADARRAVLLSGLLRFPIVLAYCLFGLLLAGFVATEPAFAARLDGARLDDLVPLFIVHHLPTGLTGLLVAALLAAAMSSLDSALNALSAATMRDVVEPRWGPRLAGRSYAAASRATTVAWGALCTAFAFAVPAISPSVIEAVNKVGSLFFGPVLAVFALGVLARRASATGAATGLAAGLAANAALAIGAPGVPWLWWNAVGFAVAFGAGLATPRASPRDERGVIGARPRFGRAWLALSVHFALALLATSALGRLLR